MRDRTAAKRQAHFRRRMKEKGFKLKQIWVDTEGFPGKAGGGLRQVRPMMTVDELLAEIVRLTGNTDPDFNRRLCGELYAYAKGLKAIWEDARRTPGLPGMDGERKNEKEEGNLLF
jgi:hypothetical protein